VHFCPSRTLISCTIRFAGGNLGRFGMDDVLLPAPPLDPDAALDPVALLDRNAALDPVALLESIATRVRGGGYVAERRNISSTQITPVEVLVLWPFKVRVVVPFKVPVLCRLRCRVVRVTTCAATGDVARAVQ